MSAFGGKADMAFLGITLSWSLLGVKRTSLFAAHMSAFDPKRTCGRGQPYDIFLTRHKIGLPSNSLRLHTGWIVSPDRSRTLAKEGSELWSEAIQVRSTSCKGASDGKEIYRSMRVRRRKVRVRYQSHLRRRLSLP